jgi:hypothetical protein
VSSLFPHAITGALELILTILIFYIASTTDGRFTDNQKQQMFCLLWSLTGEAKRMEFAPSPSVPVPS